MTATVTHVDHAGWSQPGAPRVLVLDRVDPAGLVALGGLAELDVRDAVEPAELLTIIGQYDALMVRSATKVTAEVLAAGTRLKIVGRAGVGVDNIDVAAATQRGVIVVNSPEGNTVAAAEHALALMFALARHIPAADAAMKAGGWGRERFTGLELYNKTLGILGLGKIGARVAKVALAVGMHVLACDPFLSAERAVELGVEPVDFETMIASSDFITLHVPKTPETTKLFNAQSLARCKAGIRLINCARGGVIDEAALAEALVSGHVAAAALDVYEKEPLGESPLRGLANVILTPHLGASTEEAQIKVAVDVAEQIAAVLQGESARSAVNIPSLRLEVLEPVRPFMGLAEQLGSLAVQLLEGPCDRIEVLFHGGLAAKNVDPLMTAVLKGALTHAVLEGVNFVNAPILAKERGISVRESRSNELKDYADLISVTVHAGATAHTVEGTVFAEGGARVVHLDDQAFNLAPEGNVLIVPHRDEPGTIGKVGTLLGARGVNIYGFQLGRKFKNGPALMILNVDDAIAPEVVADLSALEGFGAVRYVRL